MLTRDEYLAAWSRWHGGTDPGDSRLVHGWLTAGLHAGRAAGRAPRWSPPRSGCSSPARRSGRRRPAGLAARAGLLVGLSGLLDSLDGALAIAGGRASRRGFVLDSAVDRLTEVAYAGAFWVAGAPGWLAAAFGALCWLPDYLRARAGQAGVSEPAPSRCGSGPPGWRWPASPSVGRASSPASAWSSRSSPPGRRSGSCSASSGAQLGVQLRRALGDRSGAARCRTDRPDGHRCRPCSGS